MIAGIIFQRYLNIMNIRLFLSYSLILPFELIEHLQQSVILFSLLFINDSFYFYLRLFRLNLDFIKLFDGLFVLFQQSIIFFLKLCVSYVLNLSWPILELIQLNSHRLKLFLCSQVRVILNHGLPWHRLHPFISLSNFIVLTLQCLVLLTQGSLRCIFELKLFVLIL